MSKKFCEFAPWFPTGVSWANKGAMSRCQGCWKFFHYLHFVTFKIAWGTNKYFHYLVRVQRTKKDYERLPWGHSILLNGIRFTFFVVLVLFCPILFTLVIFWNGRNVLECLSQQWRMEWAAKSERESKR